MSIVETREIVFAPSYRLISVRDYHLAGRPGGNAARAAAYRDIVGASEYEVFVVCAQDQLKVRLAVTVHDEPVAADRGPGADSWRFVLPFPNGYLHAGDEFGTVVNLNLPVGGPWTVIVRHRGRAEAVDALDRVWPHVAALPLPETMKVLDVYSAIEEYQIALFPSR